MQGGVDLVNGLEVVLRHVPEGQVAQVPRVVHHLPPRCRKVDVRLPGKGDSNSHDARPVHQSISMIKWMRTSRLSRKNSLSLHHLPQRLELRVEGLQVWGLGVRFRV